jgi:phosphopantetheinyl transferase (holo-ACP synthase)
VIYGIGTDICDMRRMPRRWSGMGERFARKSVLSDGELRGVAAPAARVGRRAA